MLSGRVDRQALLRKQRLEVGYVVRVAVARHQEERDRHVQGICLMGLVENVWDVSQQYLGHLLCRKTFGVLAYAGRHDITYYVV